MNVRGLGDYQKCRKVFDYLRSKRFNVIFMQETHSVLKSEKQ